MAYRRFGIGSVISCLTLAGLVLGACGDDDDGSSATPGTGKAGHSCRATSDCEPELACIKNVCSKSSAPPDSPDGASPVTVVSGSEGESCSARTDCDDGLKCINNVCTSDPVGQGDDGGAQVSAGTEGESCGARRDCGVGLLCVNNVCVSGPISEGPDAGPVASRGQRGESCRTRADCDRNLACIGNVCALSAFGLQPTNKECVRVECREAADCCPDPPGACDDYKMFCDDPLNPNQQFYCDQYDAVCVCDEAEYECVEDQCAFIQTCDPDDPLSCPANLVCDEDRCVACVEDDDCPGDQTCSDNTCTASCELDEQCPVFHRCVDGGCQEVGCETDRECVASMRSPLAFCEDGECRTPCSSDLECNPGAYQFRGCIDGYCEALGCETDEECRIRLNITPTSNAEAECREVE